MVTDQHASSSAHEGYQQVGKGDLPGLVDDRKVELQLGEQRAGRGADAGGCHDIGIPHEFALKILVGLTHSVAPLPEQGGLPVKQPHRLSKPDPKLLPIVQARRVVGW